MAKVFTPNGTVFVKRIGSSIDFGVQLNYSSNYKTILYVTWKSNNVTYYRFKFTEVNEPAEMYGWEIATDAALVIQADKEIVKDIERAKALVRLGYTGMSTTPESLISEIEWKMSQWE